MKNLFIVKMIKQIFAPLNFLVLMLILNACNTKNIKSYSILETSINDKSKFTVSVKINEKYLEDDLVNIALKVKSDIDAKSQKGTVVFLLPEMSVGNGAWASIQLPELIVSYLGPKNINIPVYTQESPFKKKYFGIWVDNHSTSQVLIGIRKDPEEGYLKEFIDPNTFEASSLNTSLIKIIEKGKIIFKDEDSMAGEYYILEKNGNLSAYDEQGYILTYENKNF